MNGIEFPAPIEFSEIFDFLNLLNSSTTCGHCGLPYNPGDFPDKCLCCKKALTTRVLRESTVEASAVDYAAKENVDPGSDANMHDHPFEPIAKRARTKQGGSTVFGTDEAANIVLREFEKLLVDDGYTVGTNRDGTAVKYCRYMKMLFEHKIFTCRDDFFQTGARTRAHDFYISMAKSKADANGGKTNYKKLYKNFANGYDKFVLLGTFKPTDHGSCEAEPPVLDEMTIDEILDSIENGVF